MARSPSSPIILPCPAKRVSAFSVVDGSVYRPPYQVRPFARPGHRQLGPLGTNGPYTFCLHPPKFPARPEVTTRSRPHCRRGTGGAKARGSPAHGSILGRLSKNCKKDVSHAYKSKKTPFGTTQQSTRQVPSSSTQTQVEFKLSSSSIQVELRHGSMRAEPQAEWKSPQAWERFSTSPISPVHPPATLRPEDFFVCLPDFFVSPYRLFAIPLPTFWRLESGRPFIPYGRPRKYVALSPNQPALKLSPT